MIERKIAARAVNKRGMRLVQGDRRERKVNSCFTTEDAGEVLDGARDLPDLIERMLDRVVERVGSAESRELLRFMMETDPGLLDVLEWELSRAKCNRGSR